MIPRQLAARRVIPEKNNGKFRRRDPITTLLTKGNKFNAAMV